MPVVIGQIPGAFAAEVGGVECGAPLAAPDAQAIDAAMERYAVLVFRNQPLTDQQQLAFTRHFGELERYETPGHIRKRDENRLGPGISELFQSNARRRSHVGRGPDLAVQACRSSLALGQFVSAHSRQILLVVGEGDPVLGRRDRIRGYAGSL